MTTYAQTVSACFRVEGLGMDVTIENLPFEWTPPKNREEQAANIAALWLWRNAPECKGKSLALVWVNVSPVKELETA